MTELFSNCRVLLRIRLLIVFSVLLWAAACATDGAEQQPAAKILQIAGIEIYNALSHTVQDVTILVPLTGDYVSCGQILPESSCSTSFPLRDYRETPVQVTWKEQGEPQSMAPFKLEPPTATRDGQQAYIRVEVFAPGQAGARLVLLDEEAH